MGGGRGAIVKSNLYGSMEESRIKCRYRAEDTWIYNQQRWVLGLVETREAPNDDCSLPWFGRAGKQCQGATLRVLSWHARAPSCSKRRHLELEFQIFNGLGGDCHPYSSVRTMVTRRAQASRGYRWGRDGASTNLRRSPDTGGGGTEDGYGVRPQPPGGAIREIQRRDTVGQKLRGGWVSLHRKKGGEKFGRA